MKNWIFPQSGVPPIDGALLWLEADYFDGILNNGDPMVGTWANEHAIPGGVNVGPSGLTPEYNNVTYAPKMAFNGSAPDSLQATGGTVALIGNHTLYCVIDAVGAPTIGGNTQIIWRCGTSFSTATRIISFNPFGAYCWRGNGVSNDVLFAPVVDGKRSLITWQCNGASSFIQVDNNAPVVGNQFQGNQIWDASVHGVWSGNTLPLNTGMYAFLLYEGAQNSATIQTVKSYLRRKYNT